METLSAVDAREITETSEATFKKHIENICSKISESATRGCSRYIMDSINNEAMRERVVNYLLLNLGYRIINETGNTVIDW